MFDLSTLRFPSRFNVLPFFHKQRNEGDAETAFARYSKCLSSVFAIKAEDSADPSHIVLAFSPLSQIAYLCKYYHYY